MERLIVQGKVEVTRGLDRPSTGSTDQIKANCEELSSIPPDRI